MNREELAQLDEMATELDRLIGLMYEGSGKDDATKANRQPAGKTSEASTAGGPINI